ncbi:hypothetical protein CPC735_063490 [Coccidioides posadasii C735 delta SOWgp]|uniref:Uncharacterized protein n=1 Tax=Coccidioides posadasii (strain C735) TaxID=222929 RepID=C5P458_COCP7|nr:hypothetical protein CPC735_063490 [Coccidioides posadasii C735 delta SOWgp]EER28476.1 hypothetical protein CPC735_063490 [Coccidioides posadasii C735 delta SOWgp]|eukprot:XP_003070621.1 hypothetical protein CPC735_063490 [Coccidioides posadasii C735 delta SOWgp]
MDSLSASEQRIFSNGMICAFEGLNSIKVDYEKLAAMSGLKNASVASVLFNKAKRKLVALQSNGDSGGPVKKAATPEKVTKRSTARKNTGKGKAKASEHAPVAAYPEASHASNGNGNTEPPVKKRGGGRRTAGNKIKNEEETKPGAPIDLINDSIKLEDGVGYSDMLSDFGETAIESTVYCEAEAPAPADEDDDDDTVMPKKEFDDN